MQKKKETRKETGNLFKRHAAPHLTPDPTARRKSQSGRSSKLVLRCKEQAAFVRYHDLLFAPASSFSFYKLHNITFRLKCGERSDILSRNPLTRRRASSSPSLSSTANVKFSASFNDNGRYDMQTRVINILKGKPHNYWHPPRILTLRK